MTESLFTDEIYQTYKPLLFSLAYRMLGSAADAEDVVHDAFLSLKDASQEAIQNTKAYLCKIATNRCIDRLRSAQSRREIYVGPWLPEPLVESPIGNGDPYSSYARNESLSTAYLLLLQQLSSTERAVFLLREALQYEYDEIAGIVGKSPSNCRQIFSRAKRSIGQHSPDGDGDGQWATAMPGSDDTARKVADLVARFIAALAAGNPGQLMNVLSADVTLLSDGGGKVNAAIRPIEGAERIAKFFEGLSKKQSSSFSFRVATVNGLPGIVTYEGGRTQSVISFRATADRIDGIYIVVNPDKLTRVQ
ncbi:RNA polymerase sigma-70 factor [Cohnella suwonensis]|uniref:RNA polymerase sigma-70 factor n=1 Tax=Cohnella suwonensis TaxID=696072 RepID=A0ABW0LUF2_9BACL